MEKIKSILQNKKIQATILILLICILFIAVLISNRSGKKKSLWNYKEASDSNAQETTIITEEIIKEIDAEVETDTNGKIFSILVEEETIDLSSDEIETESASDGSVTYKVGDNTQVVVNKDGEAKVIKKETVTKVVTVNTNKNNQTGNNQTGNGILSGNIPSTSPVQPPSNPSSLDGNPSGPQEQESSSWDNTATDPSEESTTKPSEEESSEDTERTNPDAISQ
ncbi:MAG: hypothetical protein K1W19_11665 [Lachnospiraceae bacterium]